MSRIEVHEDMVIRLFALFLSCLFTLIPTWADAQFWDPDPAVVQKADAVIATLTFTGVGACPPASIDAFGRYYSGFTEPNGRRVIVGQLRLLKDLGRSLRPDRPPEAEPGIHIVHSAMGIMDGGCEVENARLEADTLKAIQLVPGGR